MHSFFRGRIHSCLAGTARNQGTFTSMALWSVQSFMSITVAIKVEYLKTNIMMLVNLLMAAKKYLDYRLFAPQKKYGQISSQNLFHKFVL